MLENKINLSLANLQAQIRQMNREKKQVLEDISLVDLPDALRHIIMSCIYEYYQNDALIVNSTIDLLEDILTNDE